MSQVFVFPGQGSQKIGMGAELFTEFKDLLTEAENILGYSMADLCIKGPIEKLSQTQYTQPALFVVNVLTYLKHVAESGQQPAMVAGHSLGEYNALYAAEVFDFSTGLKLVCKRGEIMSQVEGGGMAAVLGLDAETVKETLKKSGFLKIDVANYNSPKQTVLSGKKEDIVAAEQFFRDAGAKRYIVLPVSGAFHSRHMLSPQAEFESFAAQFQFHAPKIPVISNLKARPYEEGTILQTLVGQMSHSVRWVESIQYIKKQGEFDFTELGPGTVLSSLIRQIN